MKLIFKHLILVVLLILSMTWSNAQTSIQKKSRVISIDSSFLKFDTLSILPGSFMINNLNPELYEVDYLNAAIFFKDSSLIGKEFQISYSTLDYDFSKPLYHKKLDLISPKGNTYQPDIITFPLGNFQPFSDSNTLESNGSIARSFSVGNNQDFVLNSAMNIQLSGFLAPDLEIKANITDKNVPVQPEGNTRVIQDFDKIFIELNYKNRWILTAGDIEIQKPYSHFLNLNKKIMGVTFFTDQKWDKGNSFQSKTGGGISKGKYARQKLNLQNGKQGPYKLTGNELNTVVIILSGSERVYMDNKLLTRGLDQDYTIDYNTGELTFSAKNLITTEKEINVEYEYSELSYSRYSLYSFNQFKSEKNSRLLITVNFFNEQDLKNSSIQPTLTDSMKSFLSTLNDSELPLYPGIDTSSFYPGEILYVHKDTTLNDEVFQFYQYSTDQSQTLYRLNFTYLGENQGDYILISSGANGRVFQWIAPINNVKQGNYEPVIKLVMPKLTQMGTIGLQYDLSKTFAIKSEFAFSDYDQNLFSKQDDQDNVGYSYLLNATYSKKWNEKDSILKAWNWNNSVGYEFVNRNFHTQERFRTIEFYKDYNLDDQYIASHNQHSLIFNSTISNEKRGETKYLFNYYTIEQEFTSFKNQIIANHNYKNYFFQTNTSFLLKNDSLHSNNFWRTLTTLSKKFRSFETGFIERSDRNMFKNLESDTLERNSYQINELSWFIQNTDSIKHSYRLQIKNFLEDKVQNNQLTRNQIAYEVQTSYEFLIQQNQSINGVGTYRKSYLKDSLNLFNQEDFFVGSLEYKARFFKNALVLNTYYEAGSGVEQKKIFSFIKVAVGQGTHIWNDYNQNGIEELNEFEIAVFQNEANYIKIWITSNEYINSYSNSFVQTIQLKPALLWGNKKGFLKIISSFNNSTLIRFYQKNTRTHLLEAVNPFKIDAQDSSLITSNVVVNNTLTFNYFSFCSFDYYYKLTNNKLFLYYGPEWNSNQSNEIVARFKIGRKVIFKTALLGSQKTNNSTFYESNNYKIDLKQTKSDLLITLPFHLLLNINYTYKQKKNLLGTQKLLDHEMEMELQYRSPQKSTWMAKFKYLYLKSDQILSGNIGYDMLEGMALGKNAVWSLVYQFQISDYLLLDFQYYGRASQFNKTIHTGNMQIKVIF
jgi:hypothetical protein